MKPYPRDNCTQDTAIFNGRLSTARRLSENVFGILRGRFRVFNSPIKLSPEKVTKVILACCYLHNFLRSKCASKDLENINYEPTQCLHELERSQNRNSTNAAKIVRQKYCEYFNNEGTVQWQIKFTN